MQYSQMRQTYKPDEEESQFFGIGSEFGSGATDGSVVEEANLDGIRDEDRLPTQFAYQRRITTHDNGPETSVERPQFIDPALLRAQAADLVIPDVMARPPHAGSSFRQLQPQAPPQIQDGPRTYKQGLSSLAPAGPKPQARINPASYPQQCRSTTAGDGSRPTQQSPGQLLMRCTSSPGHPIQPSFQSGAFAGHVTYAAAVARQPLASNNQGPTSQGQRQLYPPDISSAIGPQYSDWHPPAQVQSIGQQSVSQTRTLRSYGNPGAPWTRSPQLYHQPIPIQQGGSASSFQTRAHPPPTGQQAWSSYGGQSFTAAAPRRSYAAAVSEGLSYPASDNGITSSPIPPQRDRSYPASSTSQMPRPSYNNSGSPENATQSMRLWEGPGPYAAGPMGGIEFSEDSSYSNIASWQQRRPASVDEQSALYTESSHTCDNPDCKKSKEGFDFKSQAELEQHMRWHGSKRHQCRVAGCDKGFVARKDRSRHEVTHQGDTGKVWRCEDCGKNFNRKDNLKRHRGNLHSVATPSTTLSQTTS